MTRTSKQACILVAAALSTSAGCYSTTPVAVAGLRELNGYRDGTIVDLREERDPFEYVEFDEKSVLILEMHGGEEKRLALEKIRIETNGFMKGVTREDRQLVQVNLWNVQSAGVRKPSAGKAAAVFAGVGGALALAVVWLAVYPAVFKN